MSNNFFENWRGSYDPQRKQQNKFTRAKGSSLKPTDKERLAHQSIVCRPKGKLETKIFAQETGGRLWSVIVPNDQLDALKKDLRQVGFTS